jgi:hypothetical protein
MEINKDNTGKYILIAALFMILLQGANLVGVAINTRDIREVTRRTDYIWKDYVPMWFMDGMIKNNDYKTEEIVSTLKGDDAKVKEINKKYIDFQTIMLNNMIQMRGGISLITRSGNPDNK